MNRLILLVEDEEHDVLFMGMALEGAGVNNPLAVAWDGQEAIDYLNGQGKFANRLEHPLPGLMLLDLRLPRVPGLDVLKWMRQSPERFQFPVFILSSSAQDCDVEDAYRLGAAAYIVKPSSPTELTQIAHRIKKYWLDADGPPKHCSDWLAFTVPRPYARG